MQTHEDSWIDDDTMEGQSEPAPESIPDEASMNTAKEQEENAEHSALRMTLAEYEEHGVTGIATGVEALLKYGKIDAAADYVATTLNVVKPIAATMVKRRVIERKRAEIQEVADRYAKEEAQRQAEPAPAAVDPHAAFMALRSALRAALVERDTEIDAILCALLAREHVVLLGPPGTAKSLLARMISAAIDGTYFEWLLTKFSVPEELFGPVSISALKSDRFERMIHGKLPTAEVAFLDEVFKANAAILNNLLTILNERVYHDGTRGPIHCPLEIALLASNELPQDEGLEAMFDRVLVRLEVDAINDDTAFEGLLTAGTPQALTHGLTRAALTEARDQVEAIPLGSSVAQTISALHRRFRADGRYISDRRWLKAAGYLRARAWLDGMPEVNDDTLTALVDVLWDDPSQRGDVERTILEIANPVGLRARSLVDSARAEWMDVNVDDQAAITTAGVNIRAMWDAGQKLLADNPGHPALLAACNEIQALRDMARDAYAKHI